MRAHLLIGLCLCLLTSPAHAQTKSKDQAKVSDEAPSLPAADPARPTLTNPAQIPPVGYLQFEQGLVEAHGSPGLSSQSSLIQTTKLSLNRHLLLQLATQPYAQTRLTSSGAANDQGDVLVGGEIQVFGVEQGHPLVSAISVAYNERIRAGSSPDLDAGSQARGALLLVDGNLLGFSYQTNYLLNEQTDRSVRRAQFGQTLALSHPIKAGLSAAVELWHLTQPLVFTARDGQFSPRSNAVGLLVNGAYNLRPNLIFDAGVEHGLTSTSTQWQGVAGFTYLVPHRLWPQRRQ